VGLIDTTAWDGEDAPATWRERAAAVRSKGPAGLLKFQFPRWFGDEFRRAHPELVQTTTEVFLANDLDCYAACCIMLGDMDLRPYLRTLSVPAAIIVGEEDYATPVAAAEELHKAIEDSTLTIIPGARHLTPIERPEEIAIQLMALLGRV
jgi:3-oxoadipate enol-lactonase